MRAIFLDDMTNDVVLVEDDSYTTLPFMQALVDGYIGFADIHSSPLTGYLDNPTPFNLRWERMAMECMMAVNAEGMYHETFTWNRRASFLFSQTIVGPAVIVQMGKDGDTLPISLQNAVFLFDVLKANLPSQTMTVEEVCRKYIVPRGTMDVSEAWS